MAGAVSGETLGTNLGSRGPGSKPLTVAVTDIFEREIRFRSGSRYDPDVTVLSALNTRRSQRLAMRWFRGGSFASDRSAMAEE